MNRKTSPTAFLNFPTFILCPRNPNCPQEVADGTTTFPLPAAQLNIPPIKKKKKWLKKIF